MSRTKRFTHSVFSGYVLMGVTIAYTFASVRLALHYLPANAEFGLWALVMQISGYLQLVDLGMSGSIARILIDHKENRADGTYGAVIKTGTLVLAVQGVVVILAGTLLSLCLSSLFDVKAEYRHDFQLLIAGQCVVMGGLFIARMPKFLLEAHQRYDASCYAQIGALVVNFGVMWLTFAWGWRLYSMLAGYAASLLFSALCTLAMAAWLKLFPPAGAWGRANRKTFHELFSYGREIFLLSVGLQLISASQVMVITRTLGLDAAAAWSIATKPFLMAQQVVSRLLDFSGSAFAELIVQKERDRLLRRVRDLVTLSASLAVWVGLSVALCNPDFLPLWTHDRITWSNSSNWLMALLVIVYSTTRCGIGFVGITKQIHAMKYVYLLEGIAFVTLSFLVAPVWGMNGVIVCAIVTDFVCSGIYGFWRTGKYFQLGSAGAMLGWLRWPFLYLLSLGLVVALMSRVGGDWHPVLRLAVNATVASVVGLALFWQVGLSPQLRTEAIVFLGKLRGRFRLFGHQVTDPKMKV